MSHVVELKMNINDLDALSKAADKIGCELVMNQNTYKWYGTWVGDYPMPKGFTKADLGKCEHAIRVKNNSSAYEIGVVKSRETNGFTFMYDFYNGGYGLEKATGKNLSNLCQEYTVQALMNKVRNNKKVKSMQEAQVEGNKRMITIQLR